MVILKINVDGVDYDIARAINEEKKEWKPFAVGRTIKPTSVIGARYYFSNGIKFHPHMLNTISNNPNFSTDTGLVTYNDIEVFRSMGNHYEISSHIQLTDLISLNISNNILTYKPIIITILDTPTLANFNWLKIELLKNLTLDTDSPYLKIINGKLHCIKPVKPGDHCIILSKYSSIQNNRNRDNQTRLWKPKIWRKGPRGPLLLKINKHRNRYYSSVYLIVPKTLYDIVYDNYSRSNLQSLISLDYK